MKRPAATTLGALLMGSRVLAGLGTILVALLNWTAFSDALVIETPGGRTPDAGLVLGILLGLYGVVLLLGAGLAVFVFLGRNWARITAMTVSTFSIVTGFIDYAFNGAAITFRTSLFSLTLDILILLALSSTAARHFARRRKSAG
ncbi:hypothetical protein [Cryobacterium cryoconiti]|uniref:Uncharacterized protein n=1 Tax=Cryobacterium cryoconiti TaxID=1259239 RepID=A0A4Y8JYW7_9MICO|nr:hypothetical protein E3T49_04985 [Cryobacterium cryoconiti]